MIDDDQPTRHFLRSVLESWRARHATRADDAIRVALAADVKCMVTRVGRDGRERVSRPASAPRRPLGRTVPTPHRLIPPDTKSVRVLAAGFQVCLMKPVDGDDLRSRGPGGVPPLRRRRAWIRPCSPANPAQTARAPLAEKPSSDIRSSWATGSRWLVMTATVEVARSPRVLT